MELEVSSQHNQSVPLNNEVPNENLGNNDGDGNSIMQTKIEKGNSELDSANILSHSHPVNKKEKRNVCTERRKKTTHTKSRKVLSELHPNQLICKRPELYVGLAPWDFLIDSSNVSQTIQDGDPYRNLEDSMSMSRKRLKVTIERLDELIVKFQNLVKEPCHYDQNEDSRSSRGK